MAVDVYNGLTSALVATSIPRLKARAWCGDLCWDAFPTIPCAYSIPANTRHWTNVGLMLARRLRRRANINPTLVQCLVFAGISVRCSLWATLLSLPDSRYLSGWGVACGGQRLIWARYRCSPGKRLPDSHSVYALWTCHTQSNSWPGLVRHCCQKQLVVSAV